MGPIFSQDLFFHTLSKIVVNVKYLVSLGGSRGEGEAVTVSYCLTQKQHWSFQMEALM